MLRSSIRSSLLMSHHFNVICWVAGDPDLVCICWFLQNELAPWAPAFSLKTVLFEEPHAANIKRILLADIRPRNAALAYEANNLGWRLLYICCVGLLSDSHGEQQQTTTKQNTRRAAWPYLLRRFDDGEYLHTDGHPRVPKWLRVTMMRP